MYLNEIELILPVDWAQELEVVKAIPKNYIYPDLKI